MYSGKVKGIVKKSSGEYLCSVFLNLPFLPMKCTLDVLIPGGLLNFGGIGRDGFTPSHAYTLALAKSDCDIWNSMNSRFLLLNTFTIPLQPPWTPNN